MTSNPIPQSTPQMEPASAQGLVDSIDELIYRRLSQLTASDANASERKELAKNARLALVEYVKTILGEKR